MCIYATVLRHGCESWHLFANYSTAIPAHTRAPHFRNPLAMLFPGKRETLLMYSGLTLSKLIHFRCLKTGDLPKLWRMMLM